MPASSELSTKCEAPSLRASASLALEVLKTVKADADLASIPVVILTTSSAEADIAKAYDDHANSYLVKPMDLPQFNQLMDAIGFYWLVWNQHPDRHGNAGVLFEKQA